MAVLSGSHHKRIIAVSASPPKHIGGIVDCGVAVTVDGLGLIGCVRCKREKVEPAPAIVLQRCGAGLGRDGLVDES
jgi:hypothetical protein